VKESKKDSDAKETKEREKHAKKNKKEHKKTEEVIEKDAAMEKDKKEKKSKSDQKDVEGTTDTKDRKEKKDKKGKKEQKEHKEEEKTPVKRQPEDAQPAASAKRSKLAQVDAEETKKKAQSSREEPEAADGSNSEPDDDDNDEGKTAGSGKNDPNHNSERKAEKAANRKFNYALGKAPADVQEVYKTLNGTLRAEFRRSWQLEKDPMWGFATMYRTKTLSELEAAKQKQVFKTEEQLRKLLGKRADAYMSDPNNKKIINRGIEMWPWTELSSKTVQEMRQSKVAECKAECSAEQMGSLVPNAVDDKKQLALPVAISEF